MMYGAKDMDDDELTAREEKLADDGNNLEDQLTEIDEEMREIHGEMKRRGIESEYVD